MDLLAAIFFVNQSAKRATIDSARRKELYRLKCGGIMHAVRRGELAFSGWHNGLPLYTGGGYTFHGRYAPNGEQRPEQTYERPSAAKSTRILKKRYFYRAHEILKAIPYDDSGFYKVPAQSLQSHDVCV